MLMQLFPVYKTKQNKMARTITYWYDYIITQKNTMSTLSVLQPNIDTAQTLLTDITTTSRVARWRLWVWAQAACAYVLDVTFDLALINFEAISKRSRFGTLPWYVDKSFAFQYGDSLTYQNNEWQYASITAINQIIKRAAAEENGNVVNLKVAQLVANLPVKLSIPQKAAFDAYVAKIKPAGITVNIISDDADEARFYLKVNYNALLLDSTGQLITSPGTYPVTEAIDAYLSNLNYNFNGTVELSEFIDKVQAATGVVSAYILQASARYGSNPFVIFTERYKANAGHMVVDPTNPLSTTITYQPI